MTLKELFKQDTVYRKNVSRLMKIERYDETWMNQLEGLHVSRSITALNVNSLLQSSKKITLESNIDNQASRSSCVTIKVKAMKQMLTVDEALDYLRKYLISKYADELKKRGYTTITAKREAINLTLEPIIRISKRLQFVIKLADVIIDDCTAAGYTIKSVNDTLNLQSKER